MKEDIRETISSHIDDNIEYLKDLLKGNSDIVFREFYIDNTKALIMYIDGMGDKLLLNNFVLESLMLNCKELELDEIKDRILTVSDLREVEKLNESVNAVLSGDTLMLIDGMDICYIIATRFWPTRGVSEPSSETTIRGSRDGFTEAVRFNTALVRRRIRDTRLKLIPKTIGVRSKSDVIVMYIEDIADRKIVKEVSKRLEDINIDAILDSGYIEQFIEDNKWSPFPQTQNTERPDVVASALYEGRIAILVDNSPSAIIVPTTLPNLFQSPDDYYQRWIYGSILRIIRLMSIILALILPALYVAVTSYHPAIIPTKLAYFIAASREGVPFPAFIEALIMEVSLALLMESIVRLPKPIGATIGIVGGLIIGQAAVSAGIVSPIMIIIVSITAITSFTTPNYEVTSAFRIIRFALIIAASIMGLYGIMLVLIITLIHVIKLKSFGIPYLSPLVNSNKGDFKDMFIRIPLRYFKNRPEYMNTDDKIRQK
ncbi:spore germination protein [Clostridium tetanomorphum]|uniref:Spore germination protein n=1 Tax=Clostridium tetanomorphum TaxID=1553 RepID=A0A923ECN5_CLOTT|nr:spore germination protein [Clostridium tetanomorphum]KAJ48897.1 spore germination protein GerA [Clostridium tetanomorphum DSM 665]KAJ53291.1 spore germination protein GerA [Clostridium tetanomorphum DSM 665]MBC2399411.1 spore germination protein [Clostridium tetanomorphum]MBP1865677.1 spore germination protein [Clostridium tetanomorphum]NRS86797.1 spore germination protein [Clostridium tetanomorphum]